MTDYTKTELMVVAASKLLEDGQSVLVGVGLPTLAANLAKRAHAPSLEMIYESGTVDTSPSAMPLSIGDPVLSGGSRSIFPMYETFNYYLQAGRIDVGFLGGAQVDRYGNINSTVIGDYDDPDVRLPGSGGACEIASNAHETFIVVPHERRRFPEEIDFVTSPGYVTDSGGRERLGLRGGPSVVITDLGLMKFDEDGELYVSAMHPGVDREEIQEKTGWDLRFADSVARTTEPNADEIRLIREELDPEGVFIG